MAEQDEYGAFRCPACEQQNRRPKVLYCIRQHPEGSPRVDATTMVDPAAPHLHRWCGRCEREDVILTSDVKQEV